MEPKPFLSTLFGLLDPLLAKLGLTKTELVGLILLLVPILSSNGWLPAEWSDWIRTHWRELISGALGAGLLGIRDAVRKAK